jgi:hypothetical protein
MRLGPGSFIPVVTLLLGLVDLTKIQMTRTLSIRFFDNLASNHSFRYVGSVLTDILLSRLIFCIKATQASVTASPYSAVTTAPSTQLSDGTSRKRNAADSYEPTAAKRHRGHSRKQSSGEAITGMASSIAELASAFASDAVVPSPQRKRAAIHAIEDDGDLSENEQIEVYKIIRRDTTFADTLLAIRQKGSRTRFIKSELYSEAT